MFSSKEASIMDPLGGEDDVFAVGSVKDKILLSDEVSSTKGLDFNGVEVDCGNDLWTFTVFLTPPSSPNQSPSREITGGERDERFSLDDNLTEDYDVFKSPVTKDLKSMLIRDCMWNGYTLSIGETNKTSSLEKLRSLTKTPPLVDCNLRITYVDPSEIWPFSIADQVKAGNRSSEEETKTKGSDCNDEDIEVDVVGLEGTQKVSETKHVRSNKDSKRCITEKCEKEILSCRDEKPATPLTPNSSDDEYSFQLRSCVKRRRTSSVETAKENCTDQKQRVSSGDESDQDCELGRATHNVLERKRRNELKQRFQYLRDCIPELAGNDRAPKVAILQKAFSYVTRLKAEEKSLTEEAKKQRVINGQLLKRLLELQSQSPH